MVAQLERSMLPQLTTSEIQRLVLTQSGYRRKIITTKGDKQNWIPIWQDPMAERAESDEEDHGGVL